MKTGQGIAFAAAVALAGAAFGPAQAEDFYQGKTINLLIGANPGGGYDLYGRALSRHFAKHIPGSPNIVVQNMPGAGSIILANHMYARAPKDGLTIGHVFPGSIVGPLLYDKIKAKAKFKPREFGHLGTANVSTRVCATYKTSKTHTFDDALKRVTVMGGDAPGGSLFDYINFLNNEVHAKFKLAAGYKGSRDVVLAMERGEVDGICGFDWSSFRAQKPDWFRDNLVHVILQVAPEEHEGLAKMGVPTLWKYVKSKESRDVLELIVSQQVFGRPFLLPPGVPQDRLAILRKAFDATMKDKAFLADATKMGLEIAPASGQHVQATVVKLYSAPEAVVARAKRALQP
jgi:tripartite-type tricarboxylate transporter receptor subunit TctC